MSNEKEAKDILALGITASKMTAEKLYDAISSFLKQRDVGEVNESKLSYQDFNTPGGITLLNIKINEDNLSSFEKTAVDHDLVFSLKKNASNNEYFIIFQGESREQIIRALESYKKSYDDIRFVAKAKEIKREQVKENVEKEKSPREKTREVTPSYD